MTSLLVRNIARIAGIERHGRLMLAGRDLSVMESIEDAFLYVEDGVIADFGPMSELADKGYADDCGRCLWRHGAAIVLRQPHTYRLCGESRT